ncbi:MAG: hypothetical protein H6699_01020 [Myxococcales bacterium]|nr:hypothetical protein [Myxococcales bacterium]
MATQEREACVGQAADDVDDDAAIADAPTRTSKRTADGGVAATRASTPAPTTPTRRSAALDAGDSDGTSVDAEADGSGFRRRPAQLRGQTSRRVPSMPSSRTTSPTV